MFTPLQIGTRARVSEAAKRYGFPEHIAQAVNYTESRYGSNTGPSYAGAYGPMQITNNRGKQGQFGTADIIARDHNKEFGTNWTANDVLHNDDINIDAGVYFLKKNLDKTGDVKQSLFRYNNDDKYVNDVLAQSMVEQGLHSQPVSDQRNVMVSPISNVSQEQSAPFQPLQLSPVQSAPATTADIPLDNPEAAVFNTTMSSLQDRARSIQGDISRTVNRMQSSPSDSSEGGIGVGPKILATLAALSGNFGPAMQLYEQERQTAVMKQAAPGIAEMHKLETEGRYDDAIKLQQGLLQQFGPRVPELAKIMQTNLDRIRGDRVANLEAEAQVKGLDKSIKKGSPSRDIVDTMKALMSAGTPRAFAAVKALMPMVGMKIQYVPGVGMVKFNELTGDMEQIPTQAQFDMDTLKGVPGERLQQVVGATGMPATPDAITNLLRGNPVIDTQGRNWQTPQNRQQVAQRLSQLQGEEAQMGMAAKAPLTNVEYGYLASLKDRNGNPKYSQSQIAQRSISPDDMFAATDRTRQLAAATGTGQLEAGMQAPSVAHIANPVVFDLETGQRRPGISTADAIRQPNKYTVLPEKTSEHAAQLYTLRNRLWALSEVIKDMPSVNDPLGRVASYGERRLNEVLQLNPRLTGQQAIQHILKDDLERYFNRNNIKASDYSYLTGPLIDEKVNKETAQVMLERLNRVLSDDYTLLMKQGMSGGNFNVVPQSTPRPVIQRREIP